MVAQLSGQQRNEALRFAMSQMIEEWCIILIKNGANMYLIDNNNRNIIEVAIRGCMMKLLKLVLALNYDIRVLDVQKVRHYLKICCFWRNKIRCKKSLCVVEVSQYLSAAGLDLSVGGHDGQVPSLSSMACLAVRTNMVATGGKVSKLQCRKDDKGCVLNSDLAAMLTQNQHLYD